MTSPTSSRGAGHGRRWVWWGLVLTTLAFAVALLGSAWAGYRSAVDAVDALERGQAEMLAGAFRGGSFGAWQRARMGGPGAQDSLPIPGFGGEPVTDAQVGADVDLVVADLEEAGLRRAGFVSPDGELLLSGSDTLKPPFRIPALREGPAMVHRDEWVRAYFAPPGDLRPNRPVLVLEFDPVIARSMVSSAGRSLLLAAIVAGLLTLAGLLFLRLSLQFEAAERQMEERRRLSVLGEMSAVLAHEIRNPLASLKGHAQLLVERLAGDSAERRRAERVVTEASRLEALTTDLLDFAGSGPLQIDALDPVELVRSSAAEAAPGVPVAVRTVGAPERWPLDRRRAGQALVNLIRNAAQASPADAPPEVTVAAEGGRLVVAVRDHGEGLPSGEEERIFDPFFTTRTNGTGLGLAVARRAAELHGGTLTATDAPDGGAVFRLEIPRSNGPWPRS